jgi:(2Fe-2S) ferredoxin
MSRPRLHVFVCDNRRPADAKPSCGARDSAAVFSAFQREIGAHPELWGVVAVTPCGCLGPCFEGPTVVVYPEGVWYQGVRPADAAVIVTEHFVHGRPVERLRRPNED